MSITSGARIGPYEVTSPIGQGGMGVVYRARDTQLHRDVALKLLPDHFADDPDRLSRFEREAQLLASLNHPNIAQVYGLEKAGSRSCIVMELVEGETLAERLKRGPIPIDEVVEIAKQMVDALEAAHERGIVHRDLKPANIKRTPAGAVKILDFGLAKAARNAAPAEQGFSNSPTLLSGSIAGVILGTAAYMSPEQARAKDVDERTDIWAFGCVLFEMLTAKQAFAGETITDILAKVLEGRPDWNALPAETPPSLRILLEAALNKDVKERLQHIGDARLLLRRPAALDGLPPAAKRHRKERHAWLVSAVLAVALVAALVPETLRWMHPPADAPVMRFEMPAPGFVPGNGPVISPDGQRIAYVAVKEGQRAIWIRPLGALTAEPLPGTENALSPFWAPDSHRLAFFADGKLKKADVFGGGVQPLGDASVTARGAWNGDGVILFAHLADKPGILRISESGGEITPVTAEAASSAGRIIHVLPGFLPDGRRFLFHTATLTDQSATLYLGSLDSKSTARIMGFANFGPTGRNSPAVYAQGYLLFSRDRTLLAQPFDAVHGTLSGEPAPLAQNVGADFSASDSGILVYRAAAEEPGQSTSGRVSRLDRKGKPMSDISTPAAVGSLRLSSDGSLAVDDNNVNIAGRAVDIWVMDTRGVPGKLTADNPGFDCYPVFSPDGRRIVFSSIRDKNPLPKLYQQSSNGVGAAELLFPGDAAHIDIALDWSSSGIVFERFTTGAQIRDIWFLSMPDKKASLYLHNGFANVEAQLSPDGRYMAYATNESGAYQIVVQTFPDPLQGKWTITSQGGTEPVWRSDGRELYYLASDGKIMAVPMKTDPTFQPGQPSALFQTMITPEASPFRRRYAASADGQSFLIAAPASAPSTSADSTPITAVVNWTAILRKK